jgi:hypothetical protein
MRSMHDSRTQGPITAARAWFRRRQRVIVRIIFGLTAFYLLGAGLTLLVVPERAADAPVRKFYPPDYVDGVLAYDVSDPAPTSYGYFTADKVHLDDSGSSTEIDLSLSVDNRQNGPIDVPRPDALRVVTTGGAEATYLGGGWNGNPVVGARSSSSGEFRFAAPPAGGQLILEYREQQDGTPIRVAVGYARERPSASSDE